MLISTTWESLGTGVEGQNVIIAHNPYPLRGIGPDVPRLDDRRAPNNRAAILIVQRVNSVVLTDRDTEHFFPMVLGETKISNYCVSLKPWLWWPEYCTRFCLHATEYADLYHDLHTGHGVHRTIIAIVVSQNGEVLTVGRSIESLRLRSVNSLKQRLCCHSGGRCECEFLNFVHTKHIILIRVFCI